MQYTYMQTLNEYEMFLKKKKKMDDHKLSQMMTYEKYIHEEKKEEE